MHQNRAEVNERLQRYQDKTKALFDQKVKDKEFLPGNLVLKWEARKEDARKHVKFNPIWSGPYRISALKGMLDHVVIDANGLID